MKQMLPIGSIVLLKNAKKRVMVCGRVQRSLETQKCYDYVKAIRDRAHISTRPFAEYSTHSSFRNLVRNERARELCFEATRKYDLIRWGIYETAMKDCYSQYFSDVRCNSYDTSMYARKYVTLVGPRHVILPIPTIELGVNPLLKQNNLW